jgi:flagellar FliL protein
MADKQAKGETAKDGAAAAPGKGKGKLIVIIAVALALLGGGGGAAAYFMLGKKDKEQVAHEDEEEAGAAEEEAPQQKAARPEKKATKKKRKEGVPVFVELDMFTANLRDADDDRFIQIRVVAEVRDAPAGEMLKNMMPAVRNEVLLLLGSKESKDIASREGKEQLAQEIVTAANRTLENTPAAQGVEGVNFTHIIVQ